MVFYKSTYTITLNKNARYSLRFVDNTLLVKHWIKNRRKVVEYQTAYTTTNYICQPHCISLLHELKVVLTHYIDRISQIYMLILNSVEEFIGIFTKERFQVRYYKHFQKILAHYAFPVSEKFGMPNFCNFTGTSTANVCLIPELRPDKSRS